MYFIIFLPDNISGLLVLGGRVDKNNQCERASVANIIVDGKMKVRDVYEGKVQFEQVFMNTRSS